MGAMPGRKLAIVVVVFLSLFCTRINFSDLHTASGIRTEAEYRTIVDELKRSVRGSAALPFIYGKSQGGEDLVGFKIRSVDAEVKPQKAIFINGAIHGFEYLNIVDRLVQRFAKSNADEMPGLHQYLGEGGVIYLVPIFNPDGYNNEKREALSGADLNRDFPLKHKALKDVHTGLKEIETVSYIAFVDQVIRQDKLQVNFFMDYHCCKGAFLEPWQFSDEQPLKSETDRAKLSEIKNKVQSVFKHYEIGKTGGILGYNKPGMATDFFYDRLDTLGLTFEGSFKEEDKNLLLHMKMWDSLFEYFSKMPVTKPEPVIAPRPQPRPQANPKEHERQEKEFTYMTCNRRHYAIQYDEKEPFPLDERYLTSNDISEFQIYCSKNANYPSADRTLKHIKIVSLIDGSELLQANPNHKNIAADAYFIRLGLGEPSNDKSPWMCIEADSYLNSIIKSAGGPKAFMAEAKHVKELVSRVGVGHPTSWNLFNCKINK